MATELFTVVALPHSSPPGRLPRLALRLPAAHAGRRGSELGELHAFPALGRDCSMATRRSSSSTRSGRSRQAEPRPLDPDLWDASSRRTRPFVAAGRRTSPTGTGARSGRGGARRSQAAPPRRDVLRPDVAAAAERPPAHRAAHGPCSASEASRAASTTSRESPSCSTGHRGDRGARRAAAPDSRASSTRTTRSTASPCSCTAPGASTSGPSRPASTTSARPPGRPPKLAPAGARLPRALLARRRPPALQRRLGLVVDLVVADPERLRTADWLSARIAPGGDRQRAARPAPAARPPATTSSPSRGRRLGRRRLRVGDADRFALLDMDPDGTRSSSTASSGRSRGCWRSSRTATRSTPRPPPSAPSASPSSGTSRRWRPRIDRQPRQSSASGGVPSPAGDPPLLTEDVTRGHARRGVGRRRKAWFYAAREAHRRRGRRPGQGARRPPGGGLHPGHDRDRDAGRRRTARCTSTSRSSAGRAGACRAASPAGASAT